MTKFVSRTQKFVCAKCGKKHVGTDTLPEFLVAATVAPLPFEWGISTSTSQDKDTGATVTTSKPVCPSCIDKAQD